MNAIPARISGTFSSIPMVRPPHRKPSCASGCRNSSQIVRAIPYPTANAPMIDLDGVYHEDLTVEKVRTLLGGVR